MNHRPLLVQKVHPVGLAVGLVAQKMVSGLVEKTFKGIHPQLQQGAFVDIAGAVDPHMAARLGQIGGLVVFEPVGLDHHVTAAQHGLAFHDRLQVRPAGDVLARNKAGQTATHFGRKGLLQQGAGSQQQRRISGLLRAHQRGLQQRGQHGETQRANVTPRLNPRGVWHQAAHLENARGSKTMAGMKWAR